MYIYFYILVCVFTVVVVRTKGAEIPCTTPNNEPAFCVSQFSCPVLLKALGSLQPSALEFVRKSKCSTSNPEDFFVCCGTYGDFLPPKKNNTAAPADAVMKSESHRDFAIRKLIPSRTYCGLQHTDDRFYNETETALDEFPWLVFVLYYTGNIADENDRKSAEYINKCAGVLISNRYVLTNHHCSNEAKRIRLGQYKSGKSVTCLDNPNFPECTEPVLEVNIEEILTRNDSVNNQYNIALLRLAKPVDYSDFVRPICLPLEESMHSQVHNPLVISGWGSEGTDPTEKRRLFYKVTDSTFAYCGASRHGTVSYMCLIPTEKNSTFACRGEEGGPLMYSVKYQWFLEGIISWVYVPRYARYCSVSSDDPVDGVKITSEINDWILDNVRA